MLKSGTKILICFNFEQTIIDGKLGLNSDVKYYWWVLRKFTKLNLSLHYILKIFMKFDKKIYKCFVLY